MTRNDLDNAVREQIAIRHLKQLRRALPHYVESPPPSEEAEWTIRIALEILKHWSKKNKDQIAHAVEHRTC